MEAVLLTSLVGVVVGLYSFSMTLVFLTGADILTGGKTTRWLDERTEEFVSLFRRVPGDGRLRLYPPPVPPPLQGRRSALLQLQEARAVRENEEVDPELWARTCAELDALETRGTSAVPQGRQG